MGVVKGEMTKEQRDRGGYGCLEGKLLASFKVIFTGVTNFAFPGIPGSWTCGSVSFSISGGILGAGLFMSYIIHSPVKNIPWFWFSERVRVTPQG